MALGEGHDCLLEVRLHTARSLIRFPLALADERIDGVDLDIEKPLDRRLYLGFCRGLANLEHNLICFRRHRCLFRNDRGDDDVVMMRVVREVRRAHLKRASNASMAAWVKTSVLRRRMS